MKDDISHRLAERGVEVLAPNTVYLAPNVDLGAIEGPDTVIYPGARLSGPQLRIMAGSHIGEEGPAIVDDCVVGRRVRLKAGYFAGSVFLDGASMGLGAHIRPGCLLEEEANGAHTVGLKQTILLPFVTLGSLINFCDILMAGGTSRRDHSEVGSSFIHFNFTPQGARGDKATPTLVGDIPRGVMLREKRIFLGGQAGIVGPTHIDFGTVLAAGFVYRQQHGPDALVIGEAIKPGKLAFNPTRLTRMRSRLERNLTYIGNVVALWHWYEHARKPWAKSHSPADLAIYGAAQNIVESVVNERIKQLARLVSYFEASIIELEKEGEKRAPEIADQRALMAAWPQMEGTLSAYREISTSEEDLVSFQRPLQASEKARFVAAVQGLHGDAAAAGTRWLFKLVSEIESTAQHCIRS